VFATRLTRLTGALATRDPQAALERALQVAPDWSGGTRIADALRAFVDGHGRRGLARGAVIVMLSDGWERDDPERVGREMARLQRLAHRIGLGQPTLGRVRIRSPCGGNGGRAAVLRRLPQRPPRGRPRRCPRRDRSPQ
jgi:uncharacterized protein with von Willebrand factor type A (vWA) domain